MSKPELHSVERVPKIYAYATPEVKRHEGYLKIGTTKGNVDSRIDAQVGTSDVLTDRYILGNAIYDNSGETFTDGAFRKYLNKVGYSSLGGTEYVKIDIGTLRNEFASFCKYRGVVRGSGNTVSYVLRDEQKAAVEKMMRYFNANPNGSFLLYAKPRFGKTLSVYDLVKQMNFRNVLIVTNRPAIADSWYSDYESFIGDTGGFLFVSHASSVRNKKFAITREQYEHDDRGLGCIEFVSLQDLKGSKEHGGKFEKLGYISEVDWDLLVIDESHEGVDTDKSDIAFDSINRRFTLNLSGTPFKALQSNKFSSDAVFSWTYVDEQAAKKVHEGTESNPYVTLPRLTMYTYQISDFVKQELESGVDIEGETRKYAFDLGEFFLTDGNGNFAHDSAVTNFIDALTMQEKFPFSTPELRNELHHTFWLLNRVDSAKALAKKLKSHRVFKDYKIIVAAGKNEKDDSGLKESLQKVKEAIKKYDKTITLSVGQLTTGVTVPEWSAVLMLSTCESAERYVQTAFRVQNPYVFEKDGYRCYKENAYVFDFDTTRTLIIYDEYASRLQTNEVNISSEERQENISVLLNFFPVIGADTNGKMTELDAEKVLSISYSSKTQDVVSSGFTSKYLFSDSLNVSDALTDVVSQLHKGKKFSSDKESKRRSDDEDVQNEIEIGGYDEIFGDKFYAILDLFTVNASEKDIKRGSNRLVSKICDYIANEAVKSSSEKFNDSDKPKIKEVIRGDVEDTVKICTDWYLEDLRGLDESSPGYADSVLESKQFIRDCLSQDLVQKGSLFNALISGLSGSKQKSDLLDSLRGFSRTVPLLLMAYGTNDTTLENFEQGISDDIFVNVTGITKDDFCILRNNNVFDTVIFNSSVKEFLRKKDELKNYFDIRQTQDIFDYIPSLKNNQVFTPRKIVNQMIDDLEKENPGCFDDPNKTFADLYMKSGRYIAAIVKKLFNSSKMKDLMPEDSERLYHILEKQVYGVAPSEVFYKVSTEYILGIRPALKNRLLSHFVFDDGLMDAIKEVKLQELVDKHFGD